MALEDVVDEILVQAGREGGAIVLEGRKEAEAILSEAGKAADDRRKRFAVETARLVEEARKMKQSTLNLKLNKMFLQAEKDIVDALFSKLGEAVGKMDSKNRKRILERLLEKAAQETGAAFVYSNSKDKELVRHKNLQFGGTIDAIGGVIVENKDKNFRVNYTFETFLDNLKEMYLSEVKKRIFA